MVVCLLFEKMSNCVFHSCVFIFYMNSTIQNIYRWHIFSNKWYSNHKNFYICDVEGLFEWFAHKFVLSYCLSGDKEKVNFSISFKVDPCSVASLLVVLNGNNFECRIFISFQVEMLMIFHSTPESIKKSISRFDV